MSWQSKLQKLCGVCDIMQEAKDGNGTLSSSVEHRRPHPHLLMARTLLVSLKESTPGNRALSDTKHRSKVMSAF